MRATRRRREGVEASPRRGGESAANKPVSAAVRRLKTETVTGRATRRPTSPHSFQASLTRRGPKTTKRGGGGFAAPGVRPAHPPVHPTLSVSYPQCYLRRPPCLDGAG